MYRKILIATDGSDGSLDSVAQKVLEWSSTPMMIVR